jgi:hypothetical protein
MKSKNQKRRDPAELLKTYKKLCPPKSSEIKSVATLRKGSKRKSLEERS